MSPSLTPFNDTNWNDYQTVTLAAAEDLDILNGVATIRCSATGLTDKDVTATEVDDDFPPVVVPYPAADATAVDPDTLICIRVTTDDARANLSTLEVRVNGTLVYDGESEEVVVTPTPTPTPD